MRRAFLTPLALWIVMPDFARAVSFQCPEPTKQVESDIKGDISGKAQAILKLGDGSFSGDIEVNVVNLFEKYPNADRVALAQSLQSMTCQLLRDSDSLSDAQKLDRVLELAKSLEPYLK